MQNITLANLTTESQRRSLVGVLAVFGGVWASFQLYKLTSFTYLHALHRGNLARYKEGRNGNEIETWALVTGSSDGIGKGFAEELCAQGFNVIIHGRNEAKLERVKTDLLAQWPERKVNIFICDASKAAEDAAAIETAGATFRDRNIRVVVNNVAGGFDSLWTEFEQRTAEEMTKVMAATAHFPTQLTRTFISTLIEKQPALIINIGSGISELPVPYMSVYAGAKSYNKVWSNCLATEMRLLGHDIEVIFVFVGQVATGTAQRETSLLVPSARRFAQSCLNKVGCGCSELWAYWPHAVQFGGLILNLPAWLMQIAVLRMAKKEKAIDDAKKKEM